MLSAVHAALPPKHNAFIHLVPDTGIKLTPKHYEYLKISVGCNHRCSFCITPSMRGNLVSRPIDEVLRETERLAIGGASEAPDFLDEVQLDRVGALVYAPVDVDKAEKPRLFSRVIPSVIGGRYRHHAGCW